MRLCLAFVLATCLAGLAGCGESGDQRAARQTVTRFYEALKRHDAKTACAQVSPGVAVAMLRPLGESGKPCVAALEDVFRRTNPHFFDSVPTVAAATLRGDHATVLIHQAYQQRRMSLTKVGGRWQITGSPDFR